MDLTSEQKAIGKENYHEAVGAYDQITRRNFLKESIAAGLVTGAGLGGLYFGYQKVNDPLRVGVIGVGDEGCVLINAINPEYVQVTAICDIRPYNIHRAIHGDWASPSALANRKGLMAVYDWKSEDAVREKVKVYELYEDMLKDPDVEAVIVALPLHLHAEASIAAMKAGKHVLTEKLMAHNIAECKQMARVSKETGKMLATGHQRHYSVLYDNAKNLIQWGLLGQLHHIRAQWHRGNLPGGDSWQQPLPGGEKLMADGKHFDRIGIELERFEKDYQEATDPKHPKKLTAAEINLLEKKIAQWRAWALDADVKAENFGYQKKTLGNGRTCSALEELCRWRLWERTGGGLMAELGSHQLDAASIFIAAVNGGKKVQPLSVHAVGGRHIFPVDRECEDHVYCTFEFPAPGYEVSPGMKADEAKRLMGYYDRVSNVPIGGIDGYDKDPNKRIVVTYSSINGNGFGDYGEVVMGTKGTLVLAKEQDVMVYKDGSPDTKIGVKDDRGGPTLDTQESGSARAAISKAAEGPVSRGYTEEIEHWAWCIRSGDPEKQPRCSPEIALADAVIALTANVAMRRGAKPDVSGGYIQFKKEWFDIDSDATPENDLKS